MDVGRHGSARMDYGYDDDAKSHMQSVQVIHSSGTKSKRSLAVMYVPKHIFHVILSHLFIQLSTATNSAPPLYAVSANQSARYARYATHAISCNAMPCYILSWSQRDQVNPIQAQQADKIQKRYSPKRYS